MNKLTLVDRIEELISSLTGNDAARTYYQKVKDKLLSTNEEQELKKFLVAICGSAKIKDVHGLSLDQCNKWDKMWSEAEKLLSRMNKD